MNIYYIIAGGIILIGLIFLGYSLLKVRKKHKAIQHYEDIRDKLTLREKEEKEEELDYSNYSGISLGGIVGGFITIIVGLTVFGTIKDELKNVCADTLAMNVTDAFTNSVVCGGSGETMFGLVTLFFALAIAVSAISMAMGGLKRSGMV